MIMSIFSNCRTWPAHWSLQSERLLTKAERKAITKVIVVESEFGLSAKFHTGYGYNRIPLSTKVNAVVGESIPVDKIKILTLTRDFDGETIYRVEF